MTMKPLADRVLIKVEKEQEEKTAGGLVLATKNPAGVPAKGKVVACGEGKFSPRALVSRWKSRWATPFSSATALVRPSSWTAKS